MRRGPKQETQIEYLRELVQPPRDQFPLHCVERIIARPCVILPSQSVRTPLPFLTQGGGGREGKHTSYVTRLGSKYRRLKLIGPVLLRAPRSALRNPTVSMYRPLSSDIERLSNWSAQIPPVSDKHGEGEGVRGGGTHCSPGYACVRRG